MLRSKLVHVFDFVDLFAGIGGFHNALSDLGGRGVLAAELDVNAARVYESWWGLKPESDVRDLARHPTRIPAHAVLTGGFPCQPFSKSGFQRGMSEDRGTLFHEIVKILVAKKPPVVMLENVRNIAGPRQRDTWQAVVQGLRSSGYKIADTPLVFSPHLLSPEDGGSPQIRERVYIMGVYVGEDRALRERDIPLLLENKPQNGWDPQRWRLSDALIRTDLEPQARARYAVTSDEALWIDTWNELLARLGPDVRLPGFPLWEQAWTSARISTAEMPPWKQGFYEKNRSFYLQHQTKIDAWRRANPQIRQFPASRRKLEWQAQDAPRDLWSLLMHLRPSGIRVKRPTYAPALVAMGQTPIYGPERRRLSPGETARLQGFPSEKSFGAQTDALSYKQVGNAVNVGTVRHILARFVEMNADEIVRSGTEGAALVAAVSVFQERQRLEREQTA